MAIIPNILVQNMALGAVIPGTLPLIGASPVDLVSGIVRQNRGRTWFYRAIDSGSGGIFDSPVKLSNNLRLKNAISSGKYPYRGQLEGLDVQDRIGYSVCRIFFSGAGTTRLQAFVVNPYGEIASVSGEGLVVSPVPDGIRREFSAPLANGNVMHETLKISVVGAGGYVSNVFDRGDGRLSVLDANRSFIKAGIVDYRVHPETGVSSVRIELPIAPPAGATFTANYDRGSSQFSYQFFDTSMVTGIDPASFNVGIPVTGASMSIVPPLWSIRCVTAGNLSAVGSLGLMYGKGYGQDVIGVESPGFGISP